MPSKHILPSANTSNPPFNSPHALKKYFTQCEHLKPPFQLPPCPQNIFHPVPTPPIPFSTPPMPSKHILHSDNTSNPLFNCPHALKTRFTQCQHLQPPFQLTPRPQNIFHTVPTPQTLFSTAPMPSNHTSPSANTSNPLFNSPPALKTHLIHQCEHLNPPFQLTPCPQNTFHTVPTPQTPFSTQMLFARIGLSVNFAKTKILPIRAQLNSEFTVPARVYEGDQWTLCRNSLVPECIAQPQSDPTPVTIECVNSYLHLGHLIHTTWDPRCTYDELMSEFSQEIDVWNNRPLPVRARLQVINSVLIPKIVYRLECIPILWDLLLKIQRWLKNFWLAIVGLPTFLCNTTLYSSHKFGIGPLHIPVVVATRMLENVSKVLCKYGAHHLMHTEMGYLHILHSAVDALHAETSASVLPLGGTSDVQEVLNYSRFWDVEIQNWVWQCKHYIDTEHLAYSDGSFFESCNKCAGAAVLEDGRTLCVRPPGYQSAYKADVYGMFLACKYSSSCATIYTDCYAVLKAS